MEEIQHLSVPGKLDGPIDIQYLGCGGIIIRADSTSIMVDPFFSNPCLFDVIMGTFYPFFRSDKARIREGLAKVERAMPGSLQQTKAIFVSHSHYDHLMDVPAIFQEIKNPPMVYLNQSGAMTCANVIPGSHRSILGSPGVPVDIPTREGSFTVTPIPSAHNPHVLGIKFFAGRRESALSCYKDPYQKTRTWPWREGQTFSFLIDFRDRSGNIQSRIFIQSNSCDGIPANLPPAELLNQHEIDLALMGVASYHFSKDYPAPTVRYLNPQNIAWVHWEDFFGSRMGEPHTVRQTNVKKFIEKNQAKFKRQFLPVPGAGFRLITH